MTRVPSDSLPPAAYAVALAGLPWMEPPRLADLLARWPPAEAWARVRAKRAGVGDGAAAAWAATAAAVDVHERWAAHAAAGVTVHLLGDDSYPAVLTADPEAPAVLCARGDLAALDGPRVTIVGSRRCTQYGREVARELGYELARRGVRVVSGLALGIDGAAHEGALRAARARGDVGAGGDGSAVGVVGSGLDIVYPRRHARLWTDVAANGVLLSEAPVGTPAEGWRFPARNRILAALADVVVVVESRFRGGSRHTVEAALARDRTLLAVPGPVRSATSELPNQLLAEGIGPARDVDDVLVALGLATAGRRGSSPGREAPDRRPPPDAQGAAVLDAIGWVPASLDDVVARSGLGLTPTSVALARLERDGWVLARSGWFERVAAS